MCVCVYVCGGCVRVCDQHHWCHCWAALGKCWLHLLASCRPEEELWAGAFGAGGAPWAGGSPTVSPPRGHACCWGTFHIPVELAFFITFNIFYRLFLNNRTQCQFSTQRTCMHCGSIREIHFNISRINNLLLLRQQTAKVACLLQSH